MRAHGTLRLVHGAFSGAWAWERIAAELSHAGHRATAIDLPGGGADETPAAGVTLDAYAARICEALAADPEPAILAGHSMGGVAVTQAVAPFATPVSIPAGALDGLRRAYVRCLQDRAIAPALRRRMIAENPWVEVAEIDTGHSPYLSAPAELLVALERFAALVDA